MKKIFLFILVLSCSLRTAIGQETIPFESKKWTVRTFLFSQPYTFDRHNPLPSFFTGIGGKLNFEQISYRLSVEQINYKNEFEERFQKAYFTETTLKAGAEYKLKYYEVINLNFFVDGAFSKIDQESRFLQADSNINVTENYDGYAVGAMFGIGFDYFLKENLSLSIETRLDVLHVSTDYDKEDFYNNYSVSYLSTNSIFKLNILGNFCLNYHF
ncbi:MAG: hypothetical protein ABF258_00715 [Flavobacteriales bacterium]